MPSNGDRFASVINLLILLRGFLVSQLKIGFTFCIWFSLQKFEHRQFKLLSQFRLISPPLSGDTNWASPCSRRVNAWLTCSVIQASWSSNLSYSSASCSVKLRQASLNRWPLSQTLCFFIDAKVKMRNRRATHFCIGAMTGKGHDDINEMKGRHTPVSR